MLAFIARRLLSLIPLILGVTLLASILMYLSPGDVLTKMRGNPDFNEAHVAELEQRYGLVDESGEPTRWFVRYGAWLSSVVTGDFGESITYRIPVWDLLMQRVPATVILSLTSLLFAWMIAIPLGVLAAIKKDSVFDRAASLLAYAGLSIPEFFLAIIAVYVAAVTGWLPVGGRSSIGSEYLPFFHQVADYLYHLILPTIVLGLGGVASMMRIMRGNFIDYLRQDFVNTARAKGLPEGIVMFKHVLRNAINPLITAMGFSFASLLSGALLVENIMNYPGLGQLVFQALTEEDEFVVMAALVVSTVMLVMGNLLADIALAWSDPRIRLESAAAPSSNQTKAVAIIVAGIAGILALDILIESVFPNAIPAILSVLKYLGLALAGIIGVACVCLVGYSAFTLSRRLWKPILQHPAGALSLGTLLLLYGLMIGADVLSPYAYDDDNLKKAFHPPTALVLTGDGLQVQAYQLTERTTNHYAPVEGKSYPLAWFAKSEPYKLWNLIPMERKLFQLRADDPDARVYLLGSDSKGRCVFSRLLHGSRISLTVGLIGLSITMTLGFIIGGLAGYFGGTFDFIGMRVVEFLMSIPSLYLLLALRSALVQPGMEPNEIYLGIVVILSILGWAATARIIRGMTLSLRQRPFVLAAESMGQPHLKILAKHFLPNIASYLLVAATLSIPGYILGEAALSFLGLGITEPSASWGLMLKQAQADMKVFFLGFWWLLAPGFAIFITVIAFNVFGDVLRDVVDPRSKNLKLRQ